MKTILTSIFFSLAFCVSAQLNDSTKGHLQVIPEAGITELQQHYINQSKKDGSIEGYRVQIYNGSKAETLKKRSEFLAKFPKVAIYTLYEAPEYKAQAGDFRTRLEAEKFLKEVQTKLGSALIVKTKVNPKSLSHLTSTN